VSVLLASASFAAVAYTWIGYPALVGALSKVLPLHLEENDAYEPTVTACIPVYNAADSLRKKLESMLELDYPKDKLEILVYTDGCTDDTEDVVRSFAARDPRVVLCRGGERKGKPTALNEMLKVAKGEVLFLTDCRQTVEKGALRALLRKLGAPGVGCVSGNLIFLGEAASEAYWRYECWIRSREARFRGVVGVSGPIYAVRRADVDPVPPDLILDDVLIPMRVALRGQKVVYAEDARAYDAAPTDAREYNRKIRTLAGNYQLFEVLPKVLSPLHNPLWFETVSHKVMRLACPFLMIVMVGASAVAFLVPASAAVHTLAGGLLAGQAAFYGLAALGRCAGKLGYLCQSFVVMNAASVRGFVRWLSGTQEVTWAMPGGTTQ
jgi:cellulose synthase/poly-beta-1,6-N-acetylglucosamine synthase-like glycosyltransferase